MRAGNNMTYVPPGFVSKGVESTSASGTLKVSKSVTRLGLLSDATLTFKEGRLVQWKSKGNMPMLTKLVTTVPEQKRRLTILNVGINPRMDYLFGQDRMVAGSVTAGGFGITAGVIGADPQGRGRKRGGVRGLYVGGRAKGPAKG